VIVPDDVCVASAADIGVGGVEVFDRNGGGLDVQWSDARRAPEGTPRLVLDGDVGAGFLEVRHDDNTRGHGRPVRQSDGGFYYDTTERNSACSTRTASSGAAHG
jgi:hypothetical protein